MKFSKSSGLFLSSQLLALLLLCVAGERAQAINASPFPVEVRQPDGRVITVRARGDEFTHWYEDADGFAVVAERGQYVYATLNAKGGLAPTALVVGQDNPRAAGLTKNTRPSSDFIRSEHDRLTAPALQYRAVRHGQESRHPLPLQRSYARRPHAHAGGI